MPPAATLNSDEFDPTADEEFAMNLLREDNEGLGTQDVLGLQRELFNRIRAPPNQMAAGNANVNRSPERDVYDLPSSSPPRVASLLRAAPPLRLFGLVAKGSSSPLEHRSDNTPSSQRSASSEEPALAQDTDIAMFNPPVGRHDAFANTGVNLIEFTLFGKLPLELREMIWKASIQSRLVVVRDTMLARAHREGKEPKRRDWDYLFSTTPIPGTLFACQESRKTMISCGYELRFRRSFARASRVWYNNEHDILFLAPLETGAQTIFPAFVHEWDDWTKGVKRAAFANVPDGDKTLLHSTYRLFGAPEEILLVEDHCGHCPSTSGYRSQQLLNDPWTCLSIEEGLTAEGTFPAGSNLAKRFGPSISKNDLSSDAHAHFRSLVTDVKERFQEAKNVREATGQPTFTLPRLISYVMVMESSRAHAMIEARRIHSRTLKQLENDKKELEESQRMLSEAEEKVASAKKQIDAREASIKTTQKSMEQIVRDLHRKA